MFDEQPDGDPHGECAAEIHRLTAELEKCASALPGPYYMDPPDGGDVPVSEQLRRMATDAARYRWMRGNVSDDMQWYLLDKTVSSADEFDAAVDAAMTKTPNVEGNRPPRTDDGQD